MHNTVTSSNLEHASQDELRLRHLLRSFKNVFGSSITGERFAYNFQPYGTQIRYSTTKLLMFSPSTHTLQSLQIACYNAD